MKFPQMDEALLLLGRLVRAAEELVRAVDHHAVVTSRPELYQQALGRFLEHPAAGHK